MFIFIVETGVIICNIFSLSYNKVRDGMAQYGNDL